ncbi:MAG TPA: catalase, partial [Nannocystaceae bacterium]|nr:catalase [Nannocystaceae bacterium]
MTTDQGVEIPHTDDSLRAGLRGPTLLEDFHFREKITRFDHERIPERVVHARGAGAHGYFQPYAAAAKLSRAGFLQDPQERTPVFVRFSTVAGSRGSADTVRDVRGFATKFYTREGNFDLVGNNIPVFFIQDGIKFPDIIHAVKPEPRNEIPQAQSAHDTFWDFVSLQPETMHMVMWVMSDRAIPRSFAMMEGFGVHTFRLVDARGKTRLVKFHWKPVAGTHALVWDEAQKLAGKDPDFHRRDLWDAIEAGNFPEWELGVQVMEEADALRFGFDLLDATKLVPEELVPVTKIGKMVLDRNPTNFFAETEQVAFCPANIVPGIDFTPDPLLQGRLFSYQDTQLIRLGGPNFHEIPINRPVCPFQNFQRDGHMRQTVAPGRVNYEPNSLGPDTPREAPSRGYKSFPDPESGPKLRQRPESFADHYSQARQFYRSMTPPEQTNIVSALGFELSKVETMAVRTRMLGHLDLIDPELGKRVAEGMNLAGKADRITPAVEPRDDLEPSPALSLVAKAPKTLKGRTLAAMVTDSSDAKVVATLKRAVEKEGALLKLIAPKIGPMKNGLTPDMTIDGGPSCLFDAVVLLPGQAEMPMLLNAAGAINWLRDAFAHLKAIGFNNAAQALFGKGGVDHTA